MPHIGDEVICPHCGHVHSCSWDFQLSAAVDIIECQSCGKPFEAWVEANPVYYSQKIQMPETGVTLHHCDSCTHNQDCPNEITKQKRLEALRTLGRGYGFRPGEILSASVMVFPCDHWEREKQEG